MKDYAAHVESTWQFCAQNYGVDRVDLEILLSALLPSGDPHHPPCWLVVDSPKHVFWAHVSSAMRRLGFDSVESAAKLRSLRPRYANQILEKHLENRQIPRLYQDYIFELPPPYMANPRNRWHEAEAECLRLRMRLSWMKTPAPRAEEELFALFRRCLDPEMRPFLPVPMPKPPEMLMHALTLVKSANPALINGPALVSNARMLPTAHAVLMGRQKLEPEDHDVLYRTLLNTVKVWTRAILEAFADRDSALTLSDLQNITALPPKLIYEECSKLDYYGVLKWPNRRNNKRPKYITWDFDSKDGGLGWDMREFIKGRLWSNWERRLPVALKELGGGGRFGRFGDVSED